jgi:hypothetical protein
MDAVCKSCAKGYYSLLGHSCGDTPAVEQAKETLYQLMIRTPKSTPLNAPIDIQQCADCGYHWDRRFWHVCKCKRKQ